MLGSHNSGSFAKQIGWTKLIPKCFSRCQRLSIKEQYAIGVRYFDLRVTYYRDDYYLAHGLVRYKLKLIDVLMEISSFEDECYFSIIIEDTFLKFKGDVSFLISMATGTSAKLHHVTSKKTGKEYYKSSFINKEVAWLIPVAKRWDLHIPEIDCENINRLLSRRKLVISDNINLVDFVETLA